MLKRACTFWYRVWSEAGCPSSGVLSQIKKHARSRFKSEVRRLRRGQDKILRRNLATAFAQKKKTLFWSTVKALNKQRAGSKVQTIDGISGENDIANLMASNLKKILYTHSVASRDFLTSCFISSLSMSQLADICVVEDEVTNAIGCLKPHI